MIDRMIQITVSEEEVLHTDTVLAPLPRLLKWWGSGRPNLNAVLYLLPWVRYEGLPYVAGRGGSFLQHDHGVRSLTVNGKPYSRPFPGTEARQVWCDYGSRLTADHTYNAINYLLQSELADKRELILGAMVDEAQPVLNTTVDEYPLSANLRAGALGILFHTLSEHLIIPIGVNGYEWASTAHEALLPNTGFVVIEGFQYHWKSGTLLRDTIRNRQRAIVKWLSKYKRDGRHILIVPNLPTGQARTDLQRLLLEVAEYLPSVLIGFYATPLANRMPVHWDW